MKKEPEKKFVYKKIYWFICLIAVIAITVVRVILHFAGIELSDALSRAFGSAEIVAVAAMVFLYLRWRQQYRK